MHTIILYAFPGTLFSWTAELWVSQEQPWQCGWSSFTMVGLFPYLPMENILLAAAPSDVGHLQMWHPPPPSWLEAGSRPEISKAASRSFLLIVLKRKAIKPGANTDSHPVDWAKRGCVMICRLLYCKSTKAVWKLAVWIICGPLVPPQGSVAGCQSCDPQLEAEVIIQVSPDWTPHKDSIIWVYSILGGRSRQLIMRNPVVFLLWYVWFAMDREKLTSTQLLTQKSAVVKGYTWAERVSPWQQDLQWCYKTSQVAYVKGTDWERLSSRHPLTRGCSQ